MEFSIHQLVLFLVLLVAVILGATMHRTRFCTMGAVSDWVNIGHKGRLGAWLFAISVAAAGVLLFETTGILSMPSAAPEAFPPYRTPQFAWLRYTLGGLLFGVGMTLAGGCGSRTFVRVGAGSGKSFIVLIVAAIAAYMLVWTDLYQRLFNIWLMPTNIDLQTWGLPTQELAAIVGGLIGLHDLQIVKLITSASIVSLMFFFVLRSRDFRHSRNDIMGGSIVGLCIIAGWLITGGPLRDAWQEYALMAATPPIRVSVQSYTFISPMADMVNYLRAPTQWSLVTFGVIAFVGVIAGSFLAALISRQLRFEWFTSVRDFINHIIGAVLLGVGGVMAMGCSIGQGITGVSTLALGSVLALGAMILGSAFTMKVQYHLIDTGFLSSLRRAATDLKLLPAAKLD